jgi:cysteine desulfurase
MAYFDNNATTPLGQNALEAYQCALSEDWQNPSSPYRSGSRVRAKMEKVREELAESLGVKKDEIIFTSGATEANNAVFAYSASIAKPDSTCLISPFEHPSILEPARHYFKDRVSYLPTDQGGRIELELVEGILNEGNISMVSLMAANNETGVLQPWKAVAQICANKGIYFHCDATQWIGKLAINDFSLCSSFSASAHKFSGPKGVGWLVCKEPIKLQLGGEQEMSMRGGTENYPAIISMFTAWQDIQALLCSTKERAEWRNRFEDGLIKAIPGVKILGSKNPRLWNTSMIVVPNFDNLSWLGKLDKIGYSVSTGSACSTGKVGQSIVGLSMGLSTREVRRLIRVSSYLEHRESDWENLALAFEQVNIELIEDASNSSVISI